MKKKNGFTLVELMTVMVILAIIIGIAVPSVLVVSKRLQKNMYCTKIKLLEDNAIMWGQDNMELLPEANSYEDVSLETVTVQTLVDEGLTKKDDVKNGDILDPRDSTSMNNIGIKVYIKNKRVYAKIPSAVSTCEK